MNKSELKELIDTNLIKIRSVISNIKMLPKEAQDAQISMDNIYAGVNKYLNQSDIKDVHLNISVTRELKIIIQS